MKTRCLRIALVGVMLLGVSPVVAGVPETTRLRLQSQVFEVEKAFARTMADRDHEAFGSFLSEEAVFLSGSVLRGRQAVSDGWKGLFETEAAPFSWAPETVEVLESGDLALSTGPVYDSEGRQFSTFTSIWRLEEPGVWRVIFDRGNKFCE